MMFFHTMHSCWTTTVTLISMFNQVEQKLILTELRTIYLTIICKREESKVLDGYLVHIYERVQMERNKQQVKDKVNKKTKKGRWSTYWILMSGKLKLVYVIMFNFRLNFFKKICKDENSNYIILLFQTCGLR